MVELNFKILEEDWQVSDLADRVQDSLKGHSREEYLELAWSINEGYKWR